MLESISDMGERNGAGELRELEDHIAYRFNDRSILERAVTHRSWAHEHVRPGEAEKARALHNEALEFVGDSVLGLIIAEHLFRSYPDLTEGELSRMKHRLVSATTLARAAERLRLGEFLRFGRGEEKTGGRRKHALLADAFEAVLGAIYIDGGLSAASKFVLRALEPELARVSPETAAAADYKTMLQELLQAKQQPTPQYSVVEVSGPPHRRCFRVEVRWDGGCAQGEGRSIKAAEMEAARRALEQLK
ncbi:ribonuclease III [Pyrinomonas methylaliphatogenes]|uniref:ribonuclease III n=1 Tax=Pyrinomonas methylaliphatogenes TaxID=454194 RepID=UPI0012FDC33B|nr:ribonuclease III [Pyrinomonas methylaliphatogenes]